MSEKKTYRTWTVQQKLQIVLAGLRGDRSVAEVCREHQISENLFYTWREKLLEGGSERLSGKEERTELASCASAFGSWSGRLVARPTSWRSWETGSGRGSETARRLRPSARRRGAQPLGAVAHPADLTPSDLPGSEPRKRPDGARRPPVDEVEAAIVEVAEQNPTDGYRIVAAWVARKLGRAVNRKRVLRMRERKLIQRRTHEPHRRRPGFFKVTRVDVGIVAVGCRDERPLVGGLRWSG